MTRQWELERLSEPRQFPHPVNRLTLTDMHGGRRRTVWSHLQRGSEGWSVHVVGANESNTASSSPSPFTQMADVADGAEDEKVLPRRVRTFTRANSLPRICFDETTGRMTMAGMCEPTITVLDYA